MSDEADFSVELEQAERDAALRNWNKIRRDFPDVFARMAKLERELGARICQATIDGRRLRVFLDELPETAGRYSDEPPMSCGILCDQQEAA